MGALLTHRGRCSETGLGKILEIFLGENWWVLVRRGEFWLEDFYREDAKAAKVFLIFGEPVAGAAGCWRGRGQLVHC